MKKRLISLLLTLSMVFSMVPMLGVNVGAKTVDKMTEAEAYAAGFDVYMAWYNIHNPPGGGIQELYQNSYFKDLYDSVFPDGDTKDKKMRDAFDHFERHFSFKEETSTFQRDMMTYFLYECFFYSDEENAEWVGKLNYTADQLDKVNSILSNDIIQEVIDAYLDSEWKQLNLGPVAMLDKNPAKVIDSAKHSFGSSGVKGFDAFSKCITPFVPVIQAARDAAKFNNVTLMNDEYMEIIEIMYDNLDVSNKAFREALELVYQMGETGTKEAYENLLKAEAAAGSLSSLAIGGAVKACYEAFLPLAATAATSTGGAVGAAALAPAVAEGVALTIGLTALGIVLGSALEETLKFVDDCLMGSNAKRSADLDLFFISCVRTEIKKIYNQYYDAFISDPSIDNARRLNTISKLMFNTLLTENKRANECANAYNAAGLLTELVQQNRYKEFIQQTEIRQENLRRWNNEYTSKALSAYYDFESNHVKHITYDVNGGSFEGLDIVGFDTSYNSQKKIDSLSIIIAKTSPVRDGYKFMGWTIDPSATNADPTYAPGSTYATNADLTLYAVWKKANTITYDAQKGSVSPSVTTFITGESVTLPTPSRGAGYTFLGWSTNPNAESGEYRGGKTYTFDEGNITLYAIWEAKTFNVIFDANGGAFDDVGTIIEVTKSKTYNEDFVFDVTEPKRDGHIFMGWSLDNDNTVDWKTNDHENDIGDPSANDKRVYAVWTDVIADVVYDHCDFSADHNNEPANVITKTVNVENGTTYALEDPVIDSYVGNSFKGWRYYKNGGDLLDMNGYAHILLQPGDTIELDPTDGVYNDVYAKWTYYAHYNHGTQTTHATVDDGYELVIGDPVANGDKTFNGWLVMETGETLQPGDTVPLNSDITLNAIWNGEVVETPDNPEAPVTYSVMYDWGDWVDGVVQTKKYDTKQHDVDYVLSSEIPVYAKYIFKGWALDTDLHTPVYQPGDTYTDNADVVFYAVWEEPAVETYTITYDYNNGSGMTTTQEKTADADVVLAVYDPTYEGYTFLGWATSADADAAEYQTGDTYRDNADLYLYAVWEAVIPERNIIAEGTCGTDLTWALDDEGLLTIDGTGAMAGYSSGTAPWYSYRNQITDLVVYDGVTTIGAYAFQNSNYLENITLPSTLTGIEMYAFDNCDVIKSVVIPDTVTSIGRYAFYGCALLAEVKLGRSVTTLAEQTFGNCPKLVTLTIPDALSTVRPENDHSEGYPYGYTWTSSSSSDNYGAFQDSPITTINVPSTVTSIPANLYHYSTIAEFVCEDSDYVGGNGYFDDDGILYKYNIYTEVQTLIKCPNSKAVKEYTVLDGTSSISASAFVNKQTLTKLVVPGTVTTIGANAFQNNTYLGEITLEAGVTTIGEYAFQNCTYLKTLNLSEGLKTIGMYAFDNCDVIKSVVIPDTVTSIGRYAFYGCALLAEVKLGRSVTTLAEQTFGNCPKLVTLTIPDALSTVRPENDHSEGYPYGYTWTSSSSSDNYGAFQDSPITTINVPSTVTSIPANLYHYSTIAEFICEDSDYVGGNGYFDDDGILYKYNIYTEVQTLIKCPNKKTLDKYTVVDGTTAIGDRSFSGKTTLTEVQIPATVTSIGASAFAGNTYLKGAYFFGDAPTSVGSSAFVSSLSNFTVYYLEGTSGWTNPWNGYKTAVFVPEDINIAVTGIRLSKTTLTLVEGETFTLTATVLPENATNRNVIWSSTNPAVMTVTGGVVKAVGKGNASVIAITEDGNFAAMCSVTVTGFTADLNGDGTTTEADALYLLRYTILPARYPLSAEDADFDGNGIVDAKDAAWLKQRID